MKHTPEPWQLASPLEVADVCEVTPLDGSDASRVTARANAARIAACVNACAGIDDPAAVFSQVRELLDCIVTTPDFEDEANWLTDAMREDAQKALKLLTP